MKESLTPKQERFCLEYMIDSNGTRAAIAVGYSKKTAESQACRLLRKEKVQKFIDEKKSKIEKKALITIEQIVNDLIEIKERCMQKAAVMKFDFESKSLVQKKDEDGKDIWEFDAKGATKAIELLGNHLGMFKNKMELSGSPLISNVIVADQATKDNLDKLGDFLNGMKT